MYSFAVDGGVGDKTYSLENVGAESGFEFDGATLVLRDDAEAGLYTLSVLVADETQESRVLVTVLVIENLVLAVGEVLSPVWSLFDGAVATLTASGGNGDELEFGLVGDSQVFTIDKEVLSLNAGLRGHQGAATLSATVSVSDGNDSAEAIIKVLVSGALQVSLADGLVAQVHAQYAGLVGSVVVLGGYAGDVLLDLSGTDAGKFELLGGSLSLSVNVSEEQTLTVTVKASRGDEMATQEVVVVVYAPLGLSAPQEVVVTTHQRYTLTVIEGSGGDASSYSYTLTSPTLAGVSINAGNGELLLSLTVAASHTLTVQLSDGAGSEPVSQAILLMIKQRPAAIGAALRDEDAVLTVTLIENVDDAAAHTFTVTGGIAPYSYTFAKADGLSVNTTSGVLSYSAGGAEPGVYVVTVSADDAAAVTAPITLLLTVEVSAVLSVELSDGAKDGVYSFVNFEGPVAGVELSGVGGIAPYTFTLLANDNFGIDTDGKNFRITAAFTDVVTVSAVWVLEDSDTERTPAVSGTVRVEIRDALGFADNKPVVNVTVGVKADGAIYTAKAQQDDGATYRPIGKHTSFTVNVSNAVVGAVVSMTMVLSEESTVTLTIEVSRGTEEVALLTLEVRAYEELSASLAAGFVGQIYEGESGELGVIEASGGSGAYVYSRTPAVGFAGAGGVLEANGQATVGVYTVTVVVSDNTLVGWIAATVEATVSVGAALSLLEIQERAALVQGEVGEELVLVQVSGGDGLYSISDDLSSGLVIALLSEGTWAVNRAGVLSEGTNVGTVIIDDSYALTEPGTPALTAVLTIKGIANFVSPWDIQDMEIIAGGSVELSVEGGTEAKTYGLSPELGGFSLSPAGVLSVAEGVDADSYTLTVVVSDLTAGAKQSATATLLVEVLERLQLLSVPSLTVTTSETREVVYSFAPEDEVGDKIYSLENTVAGFGFEFDGAALVLRDDAEAGLYTLSVLAQAGTQESRVSVTVLVIEDVVLAVGEVLSPVWSSFDGAVSTLSASGGRGGKLTFGLVGDSQVFTLAAGSSTLSLNAGLRGHQGAATLSATVSVSDGNDRAMEVIEVLVSGALQVVLADGLTAPVDSQYEGLVGSVVVLGGYAGEVSLTLSGADAGKFELSGGSLSLSVNVSKEQTLTVTVVASRGDETAAQEVVVSVYAPLTVAQPPQLEATEGVAKEVYVFQSSGGIMPHTYTLLHNPDDKAFYFTQGTLSVNISATIGEYRFTVAVADAANMTVTIAATVSVKAATLVVETPSRLEVTAGVAKQVYVFKASGGIMPHTYTLLHNPDDNAFYFTQGTLSVNISATIGEYRFTVKVVDAASTAATVTATVEVAAAALAVAQPPRLEVTAGVAKQVYVFKASGGIMPHTYTLLHNPDDNAFHFTNGTLSVNISATINEYRFTVKVVDAASTAATVTATVEVAAAALAVAQPPRLEVTEGVAKQVYVFEASGGIMPHTYTLLHNLNDDAFYFTNGTLSVNISATIGEYRFTVAVADAANMTVTVVATVEVAAALAVKAPPQLEATEGIAEEVYVFEASGGIMPHTYTLLHNPDDKAFYFTHGTLSVNADATIGEYRFTVKVVDAASTAVTVTATVEIKGRQIFVLGGSDGNRLNDVWSAVDGKNWVSITAAGWTPRQGHQALSHNGRLYVLGGYGDRENGSFYRNDVWSSADGKNWSQETAHADWARRYLHQAVSHNGRLYVLGGFGDRENGSSFRNDVWSSADGKNWSQETAHADWTRRIIHQALSHNGRLYVLGGSESTSPYYLNDVWSSADGKNWSRETAHADWTLREGHQALSHHGRLYVLGGRDNKYKLLNDVWSSADGKNWEEETTDKAKWTGRQRHQALSLNDRLYVLGGGSGGGRQNDVWSSADGKNWSRETDDADWTRRSEHQAVVFPPELVLWGVGEKLTATTGIGANLHSFTAQYGRGDYSYSLIPEVNGFDLSSDGVLSQSDATGGEYTLTVWVKDDADKMAQTALRVFVSGFHLAEVPRLFGSAGIAKVLHTIYSDGNVPGAQYTIVAGHKEYFALDTDSGVLSLLTTAAEGVYTLSVEVSDSSSLSQKATAVATVEVAVVLAVAQPQRLEVTAGIAEEVYVFEASGGIMPHTYSLLHNPDDDAFYFTQGTLSVNVSATIGEYRFTVAVIDAVNMAVIVAATVSVVAADLAVKAPPQLNVTEGMAKEVYVFEASGGIMPHTYTLLHNPDNNAFYFTNGTLSVNVSATIGEYRFTVVVADAANMTVTVAATVEVAATLAVVQPPRLEVTAGIAEEVYVFEASGGIMPHTYTLLHNPDDNAFYFSNGTLSVNVSATIGEYRFTVAVADAANTAVTVAATVEVAGTLTVAQPQRLEATEGIAEEVYVFEASGGIMPHTYSLLHNPDDNAFYFTNGTLSVNADATMGEYRFTVKVTDAASTAVTVTATVEIKGRQIFVLGGSDGSNYLNDVWSMADGKNWVSITAAGWTKRAGHQAVSHNGRLYVLGGEEEDRLNDVWSSADGKNWSREPANAGWVGRYFHQALSHNGRLYVLGGQDKDNKSLNDVWSSADGKNWSQETAHADWTMLSFHQALSHNGRLYVLGGQDKDNKSLNDVWSSADGKNWSQETAHADWTMRYGHQALSHNGRLYVLGGQDNQRKYLNDVWSSADGKNWGKETGNERWSGRLGHQALSLNDRLYVLGGYDGGRFNDVWSSADGKNWRKETGNKRWSKRYYHQAVVFPPELVLWGVGEKLTATAGIAEDLHTFTAQYGRGDYSYSLISKVPGFDLSSDGVLSAQSNAIGGEYTLTVSVKDDADKMAQSALRVLVNDLHLAEVPLLLGFAGIAKVLHTITTDGGIPGEQYTIVAGHKEYFHLEADSGVLSLLTTAVEGVYTLSVEVSDSLSLSRKATAVATVSVAAALAVAQPPRLEVTEGIAEEVYVFQASGGAMPHTYTLLHNPDDAFYFTNGTLSVNVSAIIGEYRFTVKVTDDASMTVTVTATVSVRAAALAVKTPPQLNVTAGIAEEVYVFETSGGIMPHTYTLLHNPDDKAFYLTNGTLSVNVNTIIGKYRFTVKVADAASMAVTVAATVEIKGRQIFVLGGDDGSDNLNDVWFSADGKSWGKTANAGWTKREGHQAVSHNDRLYVLGGNDGSNRKDVWSSANGKDWSLETDNAWRKRRGHQAVSHHGRLYVLGGLDVGDDKKHLNDVWSSADGKKWSRETGNTGNKRWSKREGHQALSHNGRLYVLGGLEAGDDKFKHLNDVWSSADGKNWSQETAHAEWTLRLYHQALSHNGRLYVLGGLGVGTSNANLNDVWSSADGKKWKQETANAEWKERTGHQALSYNDRLYVLGGLDNGGNELNNVWSSADGENWSQETAHADWTMRYAHQAVVFPPELVLWGVGERLTVSAGIAEDLHTFTAQYGRGDYSYSLMPKVNGFAVSPGGVLSAQSDVIGGEYTLIVWVKDDADKMAQTALRVLVNDFHLAEVPRLFGTAGFAKVLHTITSGGVIAGEQYTIVAGHKDYFALDADSGVLSLLTTAVEGVYTLSVEVSDSSSLSHKATAVATVEVVATLAVAHPPRLEVTAGVTKELYVFETSGGIMPHTYTLLHNPDDAFYFTHGTLSVNVSATIGEYRFTVKVIDAASRAVTVAATVSVAAAALVVKAPPQLKVTTEIAKEVYVFEASGGIMPHTYTLLHNPDDKAFYFTHGTLSVNVSATVGEYRFTVAVADAANITVTVAATVEVVAALAVAQPPRLEVTAGIAEEVYVFEASGGIMPHTYTLLHNPDDDAFYFTQGTLSVNADATIGEYRFTVAVADAARMTVTVVATVEIKGSQIFVLGGSESLKLKNDVWSSADGKNWVSITAAGWAKRAGHQALSHNGRLYVLGGDKGGFLSRLNDVWSSADGKNWVEETGNERWSVRNVHQALSHNGRLYVLGGFDGNNRLNDVWSSADGKNWSQETAHADWTMRWYHQAVSHNGRLYVLGGISKRKHLFKNIYLNDVWSSADGKNWEEETDDAGWSGRSGHQALSHNGRLYVLGGYDGIENLNDVWSSVDGKNWVKETGNERWSVRQEHQALSLNDRLYVLGGVHFERGGFLSRPNDVWSSADGKNWSQITLSAGWMGRSSHQAVVFPPELVLWGVGEKLTVSAGIAENLHTFTAQYGRGDYSYSLMPKVNGFDLSSDGVLSAQSNVTGGEYTLTVWVKDDANKMAQTALRVLVNDLHLAEVPLLLGFAGIAKVLHTIYSDGGVPGAQYTIVAGHKEYFALDADSGVLSLLTTAVEGVYTLSVEVSDSLSLSRKATAVATVEVAAALVVAQPPRLEVTEGMGKEVYVFKASDGAMPYTYTLLHNPDDNAFYFTHGTLSVNADATMSEYRFTVKVTDAASTAVTVAATVEIKGKQIFVLGGSDGSNFLNDMWSAADGKNWVSITAAGWTKRSGHQALLHNGRFYILGGISKRKLKNIYLNDVWSSADGKNWSLETDDADWTQRRAQALSHHGRLYVLGGNDDSNNLNDVWSSADGKNWSLETAHANWTMRSSHQAVSHHGRLYVLGGSGGGYLNDVWSSADGKNWEEETAHAEWPKREGHQALSHHGRLYVLGGSGGGYLNDVWSSADGKNWEEETAHADWTRREGHQALSHHGRLYVLGGLKDNFLNLNDVWSSADGEEWELITLSADWKERNGHQAVVFPPELVLWGVGEKLTATAGIAGDLHTFKAQYGRGDYSYSLSPDVSGFAMSPGGVLSAQSDVTAGEYTLTVWVKDDADKMAQTALRVFVNGFYLAEVPRLLGLAGIAKVLHTITTGGVIPGAQYMIVAGNAQGYFALDADRGVLSLLSTAWEGVYVLSVEVSDGLSLPRKATVAATVEIKGSQIFVLGGSEGFNRLNDVWSTVDGKSWVSLTVAGWPKRTGHQALSHNDRLYVLGGDDGSDFLNDVWSSADGKNWSLETDDADWTQRRAQALSHHGRLYILGGWDNQRNYLDDVWSSADGKNWSQETAHADWTMRWAHQALSHNGRLYVLGGSDGSNNLNDVWSSANGKNWSQETAHADWTMRSFHQALSHHGRLYVLGGWDNQGNYLDDVWSSVDGKNWSRETAHADWPGRRSHQALSDNGRLYVLGGYDSNPLDDVWSSADGKNWSQETAHADWSARGHQAVVFPPELVLWGVGERLAIAAGIAEDLHTFTAQYGRGDYSYSLNPPVNGFAVSPDGVLSAQSDAALGEHTLTVWVKDDADNQTQTAVKVFVGHLHLAEVPLLSGFAGIAKILHTITTDGIPGEQYMIVAGNAQGYFALDADSGVLSLLSTAWEGVYTLSVEVSDSLSSSRKATVAATVEIKGRQIFVLGGSDVWSSADGQNWSLETANAGWLTRERHQALSHHRRLYVLGGLGSKFFNDVWSSADGQTWVEETSFAKWSKRYNHQALPHNGRLYVLGGRDKDFNPLNDVWSSADGQNWSLETSNAGWSRRYYHQALSHHGRLYVLGGLTDGSKRRNDVWSSADGKNWSRETDDADWTRREKHQALSHHGRLYVLGGYGDLENGSYFRNDVWSSADGKNWSLETDDAEWDERDSHQALSHNGRLYVLGGDDGDDRLNDVWSSADGEEWALITISASWSERSFHQAVVFPPELVLWGVGEKLTATAGIAAANLHTFTAQYGRGDYSYSLSPTVNGFAVSPDGVLSTENDVTVGEYTLIVWVEDDAGNRAQTAIRVEVVAQSTAQSHPFSPISPSASGGVQVL